MLRYAVGRPSPDHTSRACPRDVRAAHGRIAASGPEPLVTDPHNIRTPRGRTAASGPEPLVTDPTAGPVGGGRNFPGPAARMGS
ncbi:hypothetical protein Axi01nite_24600 [Actinoplanes xinjiangensis]|nr:hypothetical protein Axi01nite_24600 [Actinoplanes xinjiangensis]